MTKSTRAKECLELMHTDMYGIFIVHGWGGYGYFITFSDDYSKFGYVYRISNEVDTFIIFKVGLDQGDMSSKFDFFCWTQDYFPVTCTRVFIAKYRGGNKISKLDGHNEIVDRFLIFSWIILGICLINYEIPFFLQRYISL